MKCHKSAKNNSRQNTRQKEEQVRTHMAAERRTHTGRTDGHMRKSQNGWQRRSDMSGFVKLNTCSRILPEKLTRPKLLKKLPAFYGTRRFITVFTTARHLSLS